MKKIYLKEKIYTQEDFRKLPEGELCQLINGKLISSPAPSVYHQRVLRNLSLFVWNFVKEEQIGEVLFSPIDVYLEEKEAYQPDIVFISKEKFSIIKEGGIEGAPDLVIEILSPFSGYYDLKHKKEVYARCGVREYWIVDPEDRTFDIYENREGKFELIASAKEGKIKSKFLALQIDLEDVF
jgi:Uma2 family endonuclease